MNWFVAKIVYQIICGQGVHQPQFDEQLRLISAGNKQEAWQKAASIGQQEQHSFLNQKKELVEWRFINVPELYALDDLKDGMEIYSRVEEPENETSYVALLQMKASQLQVPKVLALNL
ncbi:DUF4288 domain-containing protein [Chitinophaga horti]|uniref:DUF4288 domain-containing protein n=1 Tax=Chitinophaga horti TaxID=2920382 RepID=A0ABY6IWL2_9BACT|nr:DUF4288 domain-containing protein [Chitinophaga horti]UYQ91633.1 DUF4288 domain-containing protein [Chitinophaga horti]